MTRYPALVAFLLLLPACSGRPATVEPPTTQPGGIVAADHALASQAGAAMLELGGNAVDAIVAATLAAGVVQPAGSGLGGGGFALLVPPEGDPIIVDFREVAPGAAHPDMHDGVDGEIDKDLRRLGGLAVGVPGEPIGLWHLLEKYGRLEAEQVAAPAIALARDGFPLGAHLQKMTQKVVERGHSELVGKVFDGESSLPEAGHVVRRARLADTLEAWAHTDGRALHEGPLAEDLVAAVQGAGGILTLEDLANYRPVEKEPIRVPWGDRTVLTMTAPGGGAVVGQVLSVLQDELREGCDRPCAFDVTRAHRFLEAQKHAYADRGRHMADPDFEEVALDVMLSGERIAEIREAFDPSKVLDRSAYAVPAHQPQDAGTHHISVIDADGYAVALTTTINTGFGSMVVAEKSGVILNNEMDDFAPFPSSPILEGVQGSALNHIEPGKRPVSSMSPTVVLDEDGAPILAAGASGGPLIISSTLQVVLGVLELGQSPEAAVSARRFHHRWAKEGEGLFLDTRGAPGGDTPDALSTGLSGLGHEVIPFDFFSSVQIAARDGDAFDGASNPRKGGAPARPGSEE